MSGSLKLAPLTHSLGYVLRRAQLRFREHFQQQADGTTFRPQDVGALYAIGLNPGITPSQLATALGLEAAPVAILLNQLVRRGLAERRVAARDARSRLVHLTPEGIRQFRRLRQLALRAERSFTAGRLTQAEARTLVRLLSRLLDDAG